MAKLSIAGFMGQAFSGLRRRIRRWALKRRRPQKSFQLNRNNLFIFPSGSGFALLVVMILMWLLGTNYDNNLILALSFLLGSVLIISILHTHASLSGLQLELVQIDEGFVGDELQVDLRLSSPGKRSFPDVRLFWAGQFAKAIDVDAAEPLRLKLSFRAPRRGFVSPPLLCVESQYPLGLLRCWTWLRFDAQTLVYPKALDAGPMPPSAASDGEGESEPMMLEGAEDFSGFHSYQEGESFRHISWKHFAQGKGLFVKDFQAYADENLWVDWQALEGLDREARLQGLCDWVLLLGEGQQPFGLRLPNIEIAPQLGPEHRLQCLRALASFEADQLPALALHYYVEGRL